MKLIIDIPDKMYDFTKGAKTARFYPVETYVDMILKGIPLEEELEKIKTEIKDLDLGFVDEEYQSGIAYGIMKFNQILNKHISELKGGQSDT